MRWSDMDALGHVNNVVYFRFMEQARVEWFDSLVARSERVAGHSPVIVNASCNFHVALVYPGDVEVKMWLGEPGRTSVGSYYEISKDGRHHADGAAKIVWVDLKTGRPAPLPDTITALLKTAADQGG
jgi:acyl-CoA thioester hydrolase